MALSRWPILVLAVFFAQVSFAQASQPTTQPDSSTPKKALKSFIMALDGGDGATVRTLFDVQSTNEKKMIDATVNMAVALSNLNHSMDAKFGSEKAMAALHRTSSQLTENLARIDSAVEKVDGDTAIVGGTAGSAPMTLKKVEGNWKISVAEQSAGMTAGQLNDVLATVSAQCKLINSVSDDISAGKFATAEDAVVALHTKMTSATSGPATQPR